MSEQYKSDKRAAAVLDSPELPTWLEQIKAAEEDVLAFQKKMALVEAPTFEEAERAGKIKELFQRMELVGVTVDEIGNTWGTRPGAAIGDSAAEGCIVIEAHMDTVFPKGTVSEVAERDGIYYCPGISDNTRGIAVLYGLLRAFQTTGIKTDKSIVFLAAVREEGLGGCSGLKHFLENHSHIDACISVDGPDSNVIIHGGPGIKTIEVRFYGNGGHAYKDYGKKGNPVRAAIWAMEEVIRQELPTDPKTTCEISRFEAGTAEGIHAIPAEAMLTLNFRSESAEQLNKLEQAILAALEAGAAAENTFTANDDIRYKVKRLVDIPAVRQPASSSIVQSMAAVMERLGLAPVYDGNCPTNASVSMGNGIPSICIGGGGRAGNNHSLQEWYDPRDSWLAVQGAFLELIILAGLR